MRLRHIVCKPCTLWDIAKSFELAPKLAKQTTKMTNIRATAPDVGDVNKKVALEEYKSQGSIQNALGTAYEATQDLPSLISTKNKLNTVISAQF